MNGAMAALYAQFAGFTVANAAANISAQETGMLGNTMNNALAAVTSPVIGLANTVGNLISGFEGALTGTTAAQAQRTSQESFKA